MSVWFTLLPRKAANMLVIDCTNHVTIQLPYLQIQKLLTLHWHSFSGWGREHDAIIFGMEGSQYLVSEWLQPFATEVTQDTQPKINDTQLTHIFRMGQWPYGFLYCQERLPVWWLWIAPTMSRFNYPTYKTKNCWRSIDAHFNVLSSQDLLPLLIAFMIIWT